jgi:hypothetical protein
MGRQLIIKKIPSRYYNSITKTQVSTQAQNIIIFFSKNPHIKK